MHFTLLVTAVPTSFILSWICLTHFFFFFFFYFLQSLDHWTGRELHEKLNPSWICEEATWEARIKFWEFLQSDYNSDTTILSSSSSSSSSSDVFLLQSLDRWTGSKTLSTDYTHNWCLHILEWGFLWCIHTWCSVSVKWKSRWHP
jgi:hypothetical protein